MVSFMPRSRPQTGCCSNFAQQICEMPATVPWSFRRAAVWLLLGPVWRFVATWA